MSRFIEFVECPYCGHRQRETIELKNNTFLGQKLTVCDGEDGGCDEYFVVFYKLNIDMQPKGILGCGDLKECDK